MQNNILIQAKKLKIVTQKILNKMNIVARNIANPPFKSMKFNFLLFFIKRIGKKK